MTPKTHSRAITLLFASTILLTAQLQAEAPLSYEEAAAKREQKRAEFQEEARSLVSKMTLDEKLSLVFTWTPGLERLGIPKHVWWNEALHGVARSGLSTQFPQSIGMAATWNPKLIEEMSSAIGDEARAKWHVNDNRYDQYQGLTFWSPTINMSRDPRWGRNEETYGEDPLLTARIGAAFVKGLQGRDPNYLKAAACVKHFIANNTEYNRYSANTYISESDLRNYYMLPYKYCIEHASVEQVMVAYNAINGIPCGANRWLMMNVLREEWGFPGTLVTDIGVTTHMMREHKFTASDKQTVAAMLQAGVNVYGDSGDKFSAPLKEAIQEGIATEDQLDQALVRNLSTRMLLSQIVEMPADHPYANISTNVVGSEAHLDIARRIAQQGIVLLKNENKTLPITPKRYKNIVVTGPFAQVANIGHYSGNPTRLVTPVDGIRAALTNEGYNVVHYAENALRIIPGSYLATTNAAGQRVSGLTGKYYQGTELKGEPKAQRIDPIIEFNWPKPVENVDPLIPQPSFSISWTGSLTPDRTGDYVFAVYCDDGMRLWINDQLMIDDWQPHPEATTYSDPITLQAGQEYKIRADYFDGGGGSVAELKWKIPADTSEENKLSNRCNPDETLIVYVGGLGPGMAGETRDLMDPSLPASQVLELEALREQFPHLALVLNGGTCITGNEIDELSDALLEAWYPGQEGGHALADLLTGKFSPSGRLPISWYASLDGLPNFDSFALKQGRTYLFRNNKQQIHYPFGYGLSYTTFAYTELEQRGKLLAKNDVLRLRFKLSNTGEVDAEEVVQVYIKRPGANVAPHPRLADFRRVSVRAGKSKPIEFTIPIEQLAQWDTATQSYQVESGEYSLFVGPNSASFPLKSTFSVQ